MKMLSWQRMNPKSAVLTVCLAVLALLAPVQSKAGQAGDFLFLTIGTNVMLQGYSGTNANVIIPDSYNGTPVTWIARRVFVGRRDIVSVTIPNSVSQVGESVFMNCFNLTNVTIGSNVWLIDGSAFDGCTNLATVSLVASNAFLSISDGVLFNSNQTSVIYCPCYKRGNYTISNSVTYIGIEAFNGCSGLTQVVIPNGVTRIDLGAFYGCSGLTQVVIPNGVTRIDSGAFYGCSGLTQVVIPDNVKSIESCAFGECTGLTKFVVPKSVTSIGIVAFPECPSLTNILFAGDAPALSGSPGSLGLGATNATVYYLSGTTGWTSTYGGCPTVMLDISPSIKASGTNAMISWNQGVLVETTNLTSGIWTTNNATSPLTNALEGNAPMKFYRVQYQ